MSILLFCYNYFFVIIIINIVIIIMPAITQQIVNRYFYFEN